MLGAQLIHQLAGKPRSGAKEHANEQQHKNAKAHELHARPPALVCQDLLDDLPDHLGGLGRPGSRRQALAAVFMARLAPFMDICIVFTHANNLGPAMRFVKLFGKSGELVLDPA